ncbi:MULTISPECIES: hypothetical protein [Rahnella]|uniref:hypothetical protein n=1 Tax=Rahnella TaxID=34037 RepID=UPI001C27531B|nr:hypothetical protein [Rahnella rivi]MBU9829446.1 hypothetical protein [Rahnella rivi]
MKMLMIIVTLFALTGCVEYKWVKADSTDQQELLAETECQANALRDLPPDNIVTDKYTSKDKKTKKSDTSYTIEDINQDKREILVKSCMLNKGWNQIEIQH